MTQNVGNHLNLKKSLFHLNNYLFRESSLKKKTLIRDENKQGSDKSSESIKE